MKVLISADMEGVCGVTSWVQVIPPEYGSGLRSPTEYERARLRLTQEVNAAAEGAFAGGAEEVLVNDAHNGMRNLIPEELHPEVRFITGSDKPLGMMQGVELGADAVFFVGYHAKAGTPAAPLAHTWTSYVLDVRFGGRSTGEYGINAAVAGHFGARVVLITGDDKAVAQTRDFIGQNLIGVAVKTGYSSTSALHHHPQKAQAMIREGAEAALGAFDTIDPWVLPPDCSIEVEFDHPSRADACLYLSGIKRVSERGVGFTAANGKGLMHTLRALFQASDVRL